MRSPALFITIQDYALRILSVLGLISTERRNGSRESAGIAPHPAAHTEAVVQVYAARASSWRGWLAIHTWIAVKATNATEYTVYEVDGWRQSKGLPVLRIENDLPDRHWNGKRPQLLKEFRGVGIDALIAAVDRAAKCYPWPDTYSIFPGPNCNSFTAWIAARVPELQLELPNTAIGRSYASRTVSGDKQSEYNGQVGREGNQSFDNQALSIMAQHML